MQTDKRWVGLVFIYLGKQRDGRDAFTQSDNSDVAQVKDEELPVMISQALHTCLKLAHGNRTIEK